MSFVTKRAIIHAFYVGGLTFFSTIAISAGSGILLEEIIRSGWTAFITTGISFFTSMVLHSKLEITERLPPPPLPKKKIILLIKKKTVRSIKQNNYKLLKKCYEVVHGYEPPTRSLNTA